MKDQFLCKALLALVLALSVIFGSGIVTEKTGIALVSTVYACSASSGGGC